MITILVEDLNIYAYHFIYSTAEMWCKSDREMDKYIVVYIKGSLKGEHENYTALDIHQIINN